jgi:hypothetical protein
MKVKTHSFQYISFIKALEQLLNQVDVYSQVINIDLDYPLIGLTKNLFYNTC